MRAPELSSNTGGDHDGMAFRKFQTFALLDTYQGMARNGHACAFSHH